MNRRDLTGTFNAMFLFVTVERHDFTSQPRVIGYEIGDAPFFPPEGFKPILIAAFISPGE